MGVKGISQGYTQGYTENWIAKESKKHHKTNFTPDKIK
jgi:hypothetical protein